MRRQMVGEGEEEPLRRGIPSCVALIPDDATVGGRKACDMPGLQHRTTRTSPQTSRDDDTAAVVHCWCRCGGFLEEGLMATMKLGLIEVPNSVAGQRQ